MVPVVQLDGTRILFRADESHGTLECTKVDDFEYFCALILGNAREQLPSTDGHHVRAMMLDKDGAVKIEKRIE